MKPSLFRALAVALVVCVPAATLPADAGKTEKPPRGAAFVGSVTEADGRPARDLTVVLTPLEAGAAQPVTGTTDGRGRFKLRSIPYGLYEVGFVRGEQGFPGNRMILLQPGSETNATFTLGQIELQDASTGITPGAKVAGLSQPAAGIARMDERLTPRGVAWLRTGRGVTTVVALSALLVGGIILLTDSGSDRTEPPPPAPTGSR